MESTLVLSVVIIFIGLPIGWVLGSSASYKLGGTLKEMIARFFDNYRIHYGLIVIGLITIVSPAIVGQMEIGIPAEQVYNVFKFEALLGAGIIGLGIAMWVIDKRRAHRREPGND